jgi:anti-sigma factor RsiW
MTMHAHDADKLMTLVLDAEATPDEAVELERQLAADPVLRERFAVWMGLFDAMGHVEYSARSRTVREQTPCSVPHT